MNIKCVVACYADGTEFWYLNGILHREDGPAFTDRDGDKEWYLNGILHREDGPAIDHADRKEWHLNDNEYPKKTYYKKIKKLIIKNIGLETAEIFKFNEKNAWKRLETRVLADYIEEQGDTKTANQIRNLIKFASC